MPRKPMEWGLRSRKGCDPSRCPNLVVDLVSQAGFQDIVVLILNNG